MRHAIRALLRNGSRVTLKSRQLRNDCEKYNVMFIGAAIIGASVTYKTN
jgi:hypothetical protein